MWMMMTAELAFFSACIALNFCALPLAFAFCPTRVGASAATGASEQCLG